MKSVAHPQPSYPCQLAEVVGCAMRSIESFVASPRIRAGRPDPQYSRKESLEISVERGRPPCYLDKSTA